MDAEKLLRVILRVMGAASMLAIIAVVMPYAWMDTIHQTLEMGPLPDAPIVGYLARSTSAFYALTGGLLILVSHDLTRYRPLIPWIGRGVATMGIILLGVDWIEGMPAPWTFWEGPFVIAYGLLIHSLGHRLPAA